MRVCVCVLVFMAKGNLGEEHLALLSTVLPLDRPVGRYVWVQQRTCHIPVDGC